MRQDDNIVEAEKMGIIFGEKISDICFIRREVGNKDFGTLVSIMHSHVADINMQHLLLAQLWDH